MGEIIAIDLELRAQAHRLLDLGATPRRGLGAQVRAVALCACVAPLTAFFQAEAAASIAVELDGLPAANEAAFRLQELRRRLAK